MRLIAGIFALNGFDIGEKGKKTRGKNKMCPIKNEARWDRLSLSFSHFRCVQIVPVI
jgi:hypothetical protein